jgi:hypothetical protein
MLFDDERRNGQQGDDQDQPHHLDDHHDGDRQHADQWRNRAR